MRIASSNGVPAFLVLALAAYEYRGAFRAYELNDAGFRTMPAPGPTLTSISRKTTIHQSAHVVLRRLVRQQNQR